MFRRIKSFEDAAVPEILAAVKKDRREGHYACSFLQNWRLDLGFEANLRSIVETGRRLDAPLSAKAQAYSEDKVPIGFVITSDTPLASNAGHWTELWMASIFPAYRGKGYGTRMVRELLVCSISRRPLMARCFPASVVMTRILHKCGFDEIGNAEEGIAVFARK